MRRSAVLIGGALLLVAGVAFVLRVSVSMADFDVYWRGALRAAAAEPLYRAEDGHFQFKYLPAFAVLTMPLTLLPLPGAKAVWFGASLACAAALVASSIALLPERRRSATFLVSAVVLVLGKFFARELTLGQANVLFAAVAAAALLALRARREALAGALTAVTLAIKPYGVLLVPWMLARGTTASRAALAGGALVVAALPVPIYGLDATIALYRAWWSTVTESTPANLVNQDNVSFASMYTKWLGDRVLASSLAAATMIGAIGAAAWVFFRRRHVSFPELLEGSLLLLLIPLLSPQGWDYVLLAATPAVVVLANSVDRLPGPMAALTVAAALVMGLSLFDLMGRAAYGAFMGLSVISVCASVLVAALCTLRARRVA